jgi:hypothetical protein
MSLLRALTRNPDEATAAQRVSGVLVVLALLVLVAMVPES